MPFSRRSVISSRPSSRPFSSLGIGGVALCLLLAIGCPPPVVGPGTEETSGDASSQTEKGSETSAEAKPETSAEAKPEASAEAKPEASAEAKPEASPEAKPEAKPEASPEATPEGDCAPGESRGCYTGPPGTDGVGACKKGFQSCGPDRKWGACLGEVLPAAAELCGNKLDDNCDGKTDSEDKATCACNPGQTQACYSGPQGTENVGICKAGSQTCAADSTWGPCQNEVLPAAAELCGNKIDDNCDGKTDTQDSTACECDPKQTRPCYTGPQGTDGVGECKAGTQTCGEDGKWGACVGDVLPTLESCDGKDNNCDGKIDEEDPATPFCGAGQRCTSGKCACDSTSCPTGCCAADTCISPTNDSKCGTAGAACLACAQGNVCDGGKCVCNASSCPNGCCDSLGKCQTGNSNSSCGKNGVACVSCPGGQACDPQSQVCGCGPNTCNTGCCNAQGQCAISTLTSCGVGGNACIACDPLTTNVCDAGACKCGSNSPCPTGQRCNNGACVCDGVSCPSGCCHNNACLQTRTLLLCGDKGSTCAPCNDSLADNCSTGACHCGNAAACTGEASCKNGACVCPAVQISDVKVDGKAFVANPIDVIRGSNFKVDLNYKITQLPGCPGCIDQIVVGIYTKGYGPDVADTCAYNGGPAQCPNATKGTSPTLTLRAPLVPGLYEIRAIRDLEFNCNDARNKFNRTDHSNAPIIATINVVPSPTCQSFESILTNLSLNGQGREITVAPNTSVRVTGQYSLTQLTTCPACINQIIAGYTPFAGGAGGDVKINCIHSGGAALCPNRTNGQITLTFNSPSTPGVYHLRTNHSQQFSCTNAAYSGATRIGTFAVVIVR